MVRRDEVDLGAWTSMPRASQLIVPLDTHVIRLGRCLRLTRYTSPGWRMAAEITASLRAIDPVDPVRFDFSICHVGMMNACGFGRRQGDTQCPLKGICRPARARSRGGAAIAALIVVFVAALVAFAGGWFLGARRTVLAVAFARRATPSPTCSRRGAPRACASRCGSGRT